VVQVHYDEGVAIYIGPEPCVGVREDGDEASVGEGIGQPLSCESLDPGAGAVSSAEGNTNRRNIASALGVMKSDALDQAGQHFLG
jgi:hypothetical protein